MQLRIGYLIDSGGLHKTIRQFAPTDYSNLFENNRILESPDYMMFGSRGKSLAGTMKRKKRCGACGKTFNKNGARRHRIHTAEILYKCNVCAKSFDTRNNLNEHARLHSGENIRIHARIHAREKPYKCDVCGESFNVTFILENCRGVHHTGEIDSGNNFNSNRRFSIHQRIHCGEKQYKCEVCAKLFNRYDNLQRHRRNHSGEKPYKCDVCGKAFNHNGSLKQHREIHSGEKHYECDVCGKTFTHNGNLKKHMKIHSGDKPFKCDVCFKTFNQSGNLKKHKKIHRSICDKTFPVKGIHNGMNSYTCGVCAKTFNHSSSLQRHVIIHTGDKPSKSNVRRKLNITLVCHMGIKQKPRKHKCAVCCSIFTCSSDFQTHIRMCDQGYKCDTWINKKNLFECNICGEILIDYAALDLHEKRHRKICIREKPGCGVCGKTFIRSDNLKRHITIHSEDKLYKCDVCGKIFSASYNLLVHMGIHSEEKPSTCDVCCEVFTCRNDFKSHLRICDHVYISKCDIWLNNKSLFECSICGEIFDSAWNFYQTSHCEQKSNQSYICGKTKLSFL